MADIEALDENAGETVRLEELFEKRAELGPSRQSVGLTAPRRPSEVVELPPAGGDG